MHVAALSYLFSYLLALWLPLVFSAKLLQDVFVDALYTSDANPLHGLIPAINFSVTNNGSLTIQGETGILSSILPPSTSRYRAEGVSSKILCFSESVQLSFM